MLRLQCNPTGHLLRKLLAMNLFPHLELFSTVSTTDVDVIWRHLLDLAAVAWGATYRSVRRLACLVRAGHLLVLNCQMLWLALAVHKHFNLLLLAHHCSCFFSPQPIDTIMEIQIMSWADMASIVNSKSLALQYYETKDDYLIWAIDHTITYTYLIWKLGSEPYMSDRRQIAADRTDFETNYKPTANTPCGVRLQPFAVPDVAFSADAATQTITAGQAQTIDFHLTTTKSVYGVQYYAQNANLGDFVSFQVIDIDNVLGFGANTVLNTFVTKWFIMSNTLVDVALPLAATIPAGLYIRINYTSTGVTDVKIVVNYYMTVKV